MGDSRPGPDGAGCTQIAVSTDILELNAEGEFGIAPHTCSRLQLSRWSDELRDLIAWRGRDEDSSPGAGGGGHTRN